jgi:hypothetical protein
VLQALLLPGSEGRPTWTPEMPAERAMIKLPLQFRELFKKEDSAQLNEQVGEELAKWAAGGVKGNADVEALVADYAKAAAADQLPALETRRGALWKKINSVDKAALKEASEGAARRLADVVSFDQSTVIADHLREEAVDVSLFCAQFEIGDVAQLPAKLYRDAMLWIQKQVEERS